MKTSDPAPRGGGDDAVIEADENYVGGKAHNRTTRKPAPKKAVVALVERDGMHMSEAHLARYCAEFDFRYNNRKLNDAERTVEAVKGARGKRRM